MIKKLTIPKSVFLPFFFKAQQLFLLLLLTSISQIISAQNIQNGRELNLAFESIGMEDDLDAGDNRSIKKDSRGLVWIGSDNGLFQFDGVNLKKYTSDSKDSTSIIGNYIQSDFYEDSDSNIWFTSIEGINVYKRETDNFERIQIKNEEGVLLDFSYHIFYLENNRYLWFRVNLEIYKYDIELGVSKKISNTNGITFNVSIDSLGRVKNIYACPMISKSGFESISRISEGVFERKVFLKNNADYVDVRNAVVQNDTMVWFLSRSGLILFNPSSQKVTLKPLPTKIEEGFDCGVLLDDKYLLLGGASGLWKCDLSKNDYTKYKVYNKLKREKLSFENIAVLYIDDQELLWIGLKKETKVGFSWINNLPFIKPFENESKRIAINSIVEDETSNIWSLGKDNIVYVCDTLGNRKKILDVEKALDKKKQGGKLSVSPQKDIFILIENEIYKYLFEEKKWKFIYSGGKNKILFFKSLDSRRLMATTIDGILDLRKNNKGIWNDKLYEIPLNALSIFQFYTFDNEFLFLPVAKKSIDVYSISRDSFFLIQKIPTDFQVYAMSTSSVEEEFWLGTNEGVKKLHKKNNQYDIQDDINNLEYSGPVCNIVEDKYGVLWFSSFNNLYSFNFKEEEELFLGIEDGLPDDQFILNYSTVNARNGYLWFATNNGSFCFDPQKITRYKYLPDFFIQSIEVNNEPVPSFKENGKTLKLDYNENSLEFVIRMIGTYLPSRNKLYYRCIGYQEGWTLVKSGEKLRLNKLSSGKYHFEFYIENANKIKSEKKGIYFEIDRPYWEKWWFIVSCIIAFFAIVILIVQVYVNEKLKKQRRIIERQNALQEERNRIASELHDDMGAGLSVIKFLSEDLSLRNKMDLKQENILRINSSAKDLLEKMSDIIWAMNASNDSLEDLIIHLCHYTYEYLDAFEIEPVVKIPDTFANVEISGEKRRNILLIIKEVYHNIIKHSKATEVEFHVSWLNNKLSLIITDNGIGFDMKDDKRTGNGLTNMEKRIKDINGTMTFVINNGTRVIIEVPLKSTKVI